MVNSHILCMHENQLSENEFCFTAFCNSCHFLPKKVFQEREKEVQEFHTNDLLTDPEIKCSSSSGGMDPEATRFLKGVAEKLAA